MALAEKLRRAVPQKAGIQILNLRGVLQLISSAAMAACLCASIAAAEAVPVSDVLPPVAGDQTDLEILPKPKIEAYSGRALRIERAAVEAGAFADSSAVRELNLLLYRGRMDDKHEGVAARFVLEKADPDKAKSWGEKTCDQGYELIVSEEGGNPSIRIKALGPAGLFCGIQTLKQLCILKEGKFCIREGRIEDWPSIQWRGVKSADPKLIAFCAPYKMNFGWQYIALAPATGAASARKLVEPYQDLHAEIAVSLNPGGELDLTDEYLAKVKAACEPWLAAGVRKFVLSFDDQGTKLSAATQARFGAYAEAQAYLLKQVDSWLHERDGTCQLYLCHQRYFGETAGDPLVASLAKAGLPEDLQLCWTGTGVATPDLTLENIADYEKGFGRPATFFYHNWPITAPKTRCETGPLPGHAPNLGEKITVYMMCSNHDRASEVAFLSGLDWAWNPEAYDPARSNRVAAREWAAAFGGADGSKAYSPLVAVMEWTRTHSSDLIVPDQYKRKPEELTRLVDEEEAFYGRQLPLLKANLRDARLISEIEKTTELRLKFFRQLVVMRAASRTAKAVRIAGPITLDGKLDDPAWQKAAPLTDFVRLGDAKPASHGTTCRILYDDRFLYVGIRCEEPKIPDVQASLDTGWSIQHQDFLQLCFDHMNDRRRMGYATTTLHGQAGMYDFGFDWMKGYQVKVAQQEGAWTAEFALPLSELDPAHKPAPGIVWGFNVIRRRQVKSEPAEQSSWNPCADKFNAAFCGELLFE